MSYQPLYAYSRKHDAVCCRLCGRVMGKRGGGKHQHAEMHQRKGVPIKFGTEPSAQGSRYTHMIHSIALPGRWRK